MSGNEGMYWTEVKLRVGAVVRRTPASPSQTVIRDGLSEPQLGREAPCKVRPELVAQETATNA